MAKASVKRPEWMLDPGTLISALQDFLSPGDVDPRMLALTGMGPTQLPGAQMPDLGAVRKPTPMETFGMGADLFAPGFVQGGTPLVRHGMARALKAYKNLLKVGSPGRTGLLGTLRKGLNVPEGAASKGVLGEITRSPRMVDDLEQALHALGGGKGKLRPTEYDITVTDLPRVAGRGARTPEEVIEDVAGTSAHEFGHALDFGLPVRRTTPRQLTRHDIISEVGKDPSALATKAVASRAPGRRAGVRGTEGIAYSLEERLFPRGLGGESAITPGLWDLMMRLAGR